MPYPSWRRALCAGLPGALRPGDGGLEVHFNVFGPKQDPSSEYSGVISKFISALLKVEHSVIYGDGEQTLDFVHVADVVEANILASRGSASGVSTFPVQRSQAEI